MLLKQDKQQFAENLRNNPTFCEAKLIMSLKANGITGYKFNTILFGFIPDFYFPRNSLVVEIDGSIHNRPDVMVNDLIKDECFSKHHIKVLRFTNKQILENMSDVIDKISQAIGHKRKQKCNNKKNKNNKKIRKRFRNGRKKFQYDYKWSQTSPCVSRFVTTKNKTLYKNTENIEIKKPIKIIRKIQ